MYGWYTGQSQKGNIDTSQEPGPCGDLRRDNGIPFLGPKSRKTAVPKVCRSPPPTGACSSFFVACVVQSAFFGGGGCFGCMPGVAVTDHLPANDAAIAHTPHTALSPTPGHRRRRRRRRRRRPPPPSLNCALTPHMAGVVGSRCFRPALRSPCCTHSSASDLPPPPACMRVRHPVVHLLCPFTL